MELKLIAGKNLIYDGNEDAFLNNHEMKLDGGDTMVFSIKNIKNLKQIENPKYLNLILKTCQGIYFYDIIPDLSKYKNESDLSVCFIENINYIAIVSIGESQPGRYKIYQEAIFKKL